jgi:hypothetical protein
LVFGCLGVDISPSRLHPRCGVGGGARACELWVGGAKSFIEVTICTSSNILVWFGRDASEKGVAGLTESLISSPLAIAKGLVKYERPNSWT